MTLAQLKEALATVVVVPVTPFKDGTADFGTYAKLSTRLVDAGITVLTPNGNTGEFYALNADEAKQATETAVKAAAGQARVLVGVGHDIGTATQAARHAQASGADMIMIKPAMPYLDLIRQARDRFTDIPLSAYQVSGEYSMIMAAAANGWIDHDRAMMESLTSIRRAGADFILTYFAKPASRLLA